MPSTSIPIEQTLDPGEAVVPAAAVDIMTNIVALGGPPEAAPAQQESDVSIATLILFSLIAFLIIRVVLRFLPWVLGLSVVFAFLAIL
jgi:hypothetical protein